MHLTEQIVQRLHDNDKQDPFSEDKDLKFLLLERARLTANAENKISKLKRVLQENNIYDRTHNLIYCGAGNVEDSTHESESRQIDLVTKMLGKDLGMHVSKYVAETDTARRREILSQFSDGELQGLVAIRCLDEGVDVPETRRAFILASTSNPRQFIQRRGRVLRTADNKEKATIWDFIVIPPFEAVDSPTFNEERKIIRKELKRVSEFTDLAQNGPQAQRELAEVKGQYNLFDM
jgi:superfamily II DNA or RNA helicase